MIDERDARSHVRPPQEAADRIDELRVMSAGRLAAVEDRPPLRVQPDAVQRQVVVEVLGLEAGLRIVDELRRDVEDAVPLPRERLREALGLA